MIPASLAPNLIDHFYRGGDRIAALRGIEQTSERQPEEWLAATVSRADQGDIGLARTEAGDILRDLVVADPAAWVGPDFASAASAGDTGILVKLLDARQRLPVHVHPSRAFAASHLDCPYGKTEAWFILDAEPGAAVHVGWKEDVDRDELDRRRDAQDSEWMLSRMNRIEVSRGMGVLVPAGQVHAIDEGIFLAEVQEPTDFSIVLEWSVTTSTREESHLGLGFETVMPAVSAEALPAAELEKLISRVDLTGRAEHVVSALPAAADPYFRVLHAAPVTAGAPGVAVDAGFAVALVLAGEGALAGAGDEQIDYRAGQVFAVPAGFGPWEVRGTGSVLVATPGVGWPRTLAEGGIV
ncbi:class I mannose-6-phosphate isomerase [Herbiconiux sp.]|uniref:class I mannose-6-phosphate isomerase n=1 Tax=Herbiconiux sp. TaxID=1871186 RepID=UPI0025BF9E71|nr:class I mannose-6-phosphate isomerase [Herbiconiux sp.]